MKDFYKNTFLSILTIIIQNHASAETITIDINSGTGSNLNKIWVGGNGSTPYAGFSSINNEVGVQKPENWFKNNFPFISHIRFGNFLFGHCGVASWAQNLNLEEMIEWNGMQYDNHFGQLQSYIANVIKSGVRPHIALTGTPVHLYNRTINLANYDNTSTPSYCGQFGHIAMPPNSQYPFDWQTMVGDLLDMFANQYGWPEIEKWRWTTWTELDGSGHFKGTTKEARDIVRMSRNIFEWHEDNRQRNMDFRLGNFINPTSTDGIEHIKNIIYGLQSEGVDIWDEMPGVGISVYQLPGTHFDQMVAGLDNMYSILDDARPRLINLPVHIDELGILGVTKNGSPKATYKGDPTMYGASWHIRMIKTPLNHNLRVYSTYYWHPNFYLDRRTFDALENWVKLPSMSAIRMLDEISGMERLTDRTCTSNNCLDFLATRSTDGNEINVLPFRHVSDFDAQGVFNDSVCFESLENNQNYLVSKYTIGELGNNAFSTLMQRGYSQDYRDNCGENRGTCNLNTVIDSVSNSEVVDFQRLDDIVLFEASVTRAASGKICTAIETTPHDVQWIQLKKQISNINNTVLYLDFEHSVVDEYGRIPQKASTVSFERGMDLDPSNGYIDPAQANSSWKNYTKEFSGPSSHGNEAESGAYFSEGDQLIFDNQKLNFVDGRIKLWVKPDWSYNPGASPRRSLLSWGNEPWVNDFQMYVWNQQSLVVFIHVGGVHYSVGYTIADWESNEWHLIELELNADQVVLIVDGVIQGTKTLNNVAQEAFSNVISNLVIGGDKSKNWSGTIDKLQIQ